MKRENKPAAREGCSEVLEEEQENALLDCKDTVEITASGKYRYRDCGMLFGTLEEHDEHHRRVHGRAKTLLTTRRFRCLNASNKHARLRKHRRCRAKSLTLFPFRAEPK